MGLFILNAFDIFEWCEAYLTSSIQKQVILRGQYTLKDVSTTKSCIEIINIIRQKIPVIQKIN